MPQAFLVDLVLEVPVHSGGPSIHLPKFLSILFGLGHKKLYPVLQGTINGCRLFQRFRQNSREIEIKLARRAEQPRERLPRHSGVCVFGGSQESCEETDLIWW